MASSNPNPRPLRTIRDLRDETWMVREGLAEIEREQLLRKQGPVVRYELSSIPYLGTDGKATQRDLVPHPRKIYEDDSEYIKRCKEGGTKHFIWWEPDFPLEPISAKSDAFVRPSFPAWTTHPASLLANPHENFAKTRKLPPTSNILPYGHEKRRLEASNLPTAIGAPREYTWELGLDPQRKREKYDMYQIMTNGYLAPYLYEQRKRNYFTSLFDRPKNETEKLEQQIFEEQREHNRQLREKAARFTRMTRGQPCWTEREHMETRAALFPNGWGRGIRPPTRPVDPATTKASEGLAG